MIKIQIILFNVSNNITFVERQNKALALFTTDGSLVQENNDAKKPDFGFPFSFTNTICTFLLSGNVQACIPIS